jgi:hypothetical protein
MKKSMEVFKDQMTKAEEASYQKALDDIEQAQKAAIESMDEDAINRAVEEKIRLKEELLRQQQHVVQQPTVETAIIDFEQRNASWYNDLNEDNITMRDFAITTQAGIIRQNPNISTEESLKLTEERVKKAFPSKFKNENRSAPPAVSTGSQSTKKSKRSNDADISPEVRVLAEGFVKAGLYKDVSEYVKALKKGGNLND